MAQIFENTLSSSLANAQILFARDFTRIADGTIPPGAAASILGSVSPNNDQDYWQFTLRAGDVVTFDVDGTAGLDSQIFLYNPAQAFVVMNDDTAAADPGSFTTADPFLAYNVATTGTWYLGLQSYNAATGGNYILHISIQSPNQTLFGTSGIDNLLGWMGNDSLYGYAAGFAASDTGNDTLVGLAGNDLIDGAAGNDSLLGDDGVDTLLGGTGNDTLLGGVGTDSLEGGIGTDSLLGGDNADTVLGGNGADTIAGDTGADRLEGGDDADLIFADPLGDFDLTDADTLLGGAGDDNLFGNAGNNRLEGGAGNDSLFAWRGADTILGDDGADTLVAYGAGSQLIGGTGDDRLFGNSSAGGRMTLLGGDGNDDLFGDLGNDSLSGDVGNDVLFGQGGRDTLRGGTGNDLLDGGIGLDYLDGGAGNDTLVATDSALSVLFETLVGGAGDDSISGTNVRMLAYGGIGADTIISAPSVSDRLFGGDGNDLIEDASLDSFDTIDGGSGDDTIIGTPANIMLGGEGDDLVRLHTLTDAGFGQLDGGSGNDTLGFGDAIAPIYVARLTQGMDGTSRLELLNPLTFALGAAYDFAGFEGFVLRGSSGPWTQGDTLNGGSGADSLDGGFGGSDRLLGHDGNDTLRASGDSVLFLDGGAGDDDLTDGGGGNFANTVLLGGTGNDTLEGYSTGLLDGGADDDDLRHFGAQDVALQGGSGNDRLEVWLLAYAAAGTFAIVSGGEGDDLLTFRHDDAPEGFSIETDGAGSGEILHPSGIVVFDGIERLRVFATPHDDTLRGGAGNDTFYGYAGANLIEGGGGDDFIVSSFLDSSDTVDGGDGIDTLGLFVQAAPGTFVLGPTPDYVNIERYWIASSAGNDSLTGAGDADTLDGWIGNDTLDGAGGADSLVGGTGNDLYHVDNPGDVTLEFGGEGADTVSASITHTLAAEVEALVLAGVANINGAGNDLANILAGNTGNNSLAGAGGNDTLAGGDGADTLDGGAGADSMAGGSGADVYIVDSTLDLILEDTVPGSDLVRTSVVFIMPLNVERLEQTGSGNIRAVGNASANTITGNTGNNLLTGGGGNAADTLSGGDGADTLEGGGGADRLTGGTGADAFRFALSTHGTDTVTDFTAGTDLIHIVRAGFGNLLPLGALAPTAFTLGVAAVGAGPQFIHDAATGTLRWDADGTGAGLAVVLAIFSGTPVLAASDFTVVA